MIICSRALPTARKEHKRPGIVNAIIRERMRLGQQRFRNGIAYDRAGFLGFRRLYRGKPLPIVAK